MPNLVREQNEVQTVRPFVESTDAVASEIELPYGAPPDLAPDRSPAEALSAKIPVETAPRPRLRRLRRALGFISTAYYRAGVKFESAIGSAQEKAARVSPKLASLVMPAAAVAVTYAMAKGMGAMSGGDFVHHAANMMQSTPSGHAYSLSAHNVTLMDFHANSKDSVSTDPQVLHANGPTVSDDYNNLPGGFHKNWNEMTHDAGAAQNAGDLRIIRRSGVFWYEARNGHGGWTTNNRTVLQTMADHSSGQRVFAGAGNNVQNFQEGHHQVPQHGEIPSHQPITENPGGVTAPNPSPSSSTKIIYREETPWWVWPAIAGAAVGGIAVGGIVSNRRHQRVHGVHEVHGEQVNGTSSKARRRKPRAWFAAGGAWFGRQRGNIRRQSQEFRSAKPTPPPGDTGNTAHGDSEAAQSGDKHQIDSELIGNAIKVFEHVQPDTEANNFLNKIRSGDLLNEIRNQRGYEHASGTVLTFVQALKEHKVLSTDPEILRSQLTSMGIHVGSAQFYKSKHKLYIRDDDNGTSIRSIADQLKENFSDLSPASI